MIRLLITLERVHLSWLDISTDILNSVWNYSTNISIYKYLQAKHEFFFFKSMNQKHVCAKDGLGFA